MSTPRLFMPEMISVHFAEGGDAGGGRRDGRLSSSVLFLDIPNILQRQSRISPPRHRYRNSLSLIIMFNSFHHTYHYDDGWTQSVFAETDHSFGKKCSPDSVDNSVNHPACILPSQCAVCTPPCSSKYHQPVIWQNTQPQSLTHTHTHTHTHKDRHTWSEEYRLSPISPGMWLSTADTQTACEPDMEKWGKKDGRAPEGKYRLIV